MKRYDYSQAGAYFITICARNRKCLFGEINDGEIIFNEYGNIIRNEWIRTEEIRDEIELDEFIVMPNHMHGVVVIAKNKNDGVGANGHSPLRDDVSVRISYF